MTFWYFSRGWNTISIEKLSMIILPLGDCISSKLLFSSQKEKPYINVMCYIWRLVLGNHLKYLALIRYFIFLFIQLCMNDSFPTSELTRKKQSDFERKILGRKYKSRIEVRKVREEKRRESYTDQRQNECKTCQLTHWRRKIT